ncbi:MAG: Hpt domain-containing protein [Pirellulaceae bacterium]
MTFLFMVTGDNFMTSESNASTHNDPINLDAACEMFGGDRDLIRSIVEAFLMETPQLMSTLDVSLKNADAKGVMRAAHTMKSNFNNLCLTDISSQCQQIEQLAKNKDLTGIGDQADQLRSRVQSVVAQLRDYVASG